MAILIELDDPADPRFDDFLRLRDSTLRQRKEAAGGLFIAEGEKIIRRAAQAGYEPRSFLLAPRWLAGLQDVLDATTVPCYVAPESLVEQVTGFHVHRGALAAYARRDRWTPADLLRGARRLVVAEDIVDHANVGTIARSVAGLGWDGLLLSPRSADPLYRRAIKASMGAVFTLPWARLTGDLTRLKAAGLTIVALALSEHAPTLDDLARDLAVSPRPVALLVGTEGTGLSDDWLRQADIIATIPMSRGTDSLNV
ncbi:MAG: RNA methyltransferase, partial [Propionibacteriaceae bacterium]|nr:RNA methyltransferase [Propionibacteriaceae bacterium]